MRQKSGGIAFGSIIIALWIALLAGPGPFASGQDPARKERDAAPAAPAGGAVLYRLEGQLTQTMVTSLTRARRMAEEAGAGFLIVEIDTPGGEVGLMEQISTLVFAAYREGGIETVAFINPNADSAGALIAISCRRLYMSPLAHVGSAAPVTMPISPFLPASPADIPGNEEMLRKIKARARAVFRSAAIENHRDSDLAEAMVDADIELLLVRVDGEEEIMTREDFDEKRADLGPARITELDVICPRGELLNITAQEAFEFGLSDGTPESRRDLLTGYLGVAESDVIIVSRTWSESLVDFIDSISWLLLVVGLVFLYIEFKVPGFGVPGIIGISCLALLFLSQYMAGLAEIVEILLIAIGVVLIAVEIFVIPGTFIAGAAGFILVVVGALLAFQPFGIPNPKAPWQVEMLETNVINMGLSILSFAAIAMLLTRLLPRSPLFRRLILDTGVPSEALRGSATAIDDVDTDSRVAVGDVGRALGELRPVGKILVGGAHLNAQSEGDFIEKGAPVRVVRVTGNFIFVREIKDQTP